MAFRDSLKKYRESQASQPTATSSTVEKTEQTTSGSTGSGGSFRDSLQKYRMAQTYTSSLEEWDKEIRGLLTYTQDRTSKWFDNAEYNSLYDRYNKLLAQADGWRNRYAGNKEAESYIDSIVSSLETAKKYTTDSYHIYSKYGNAEEYKTALQEYQKQQEEYNALLNYNPESDADRVKELEHELLLLVNNPKYRTNNRGKLKEVRNALAEIRSYAGRAARLQEGVRLSSVADPTSDLYDPNFDSMTAYVSTESDGVWSNLTSKYGLGYDDLTYEYINGAENGMREEIRSGYRSFSQTRLFDDGESIYDENGYDYMTEDEISIYNYYYAKDGKEAAEKYLDSIVETLRYRKATADFKPIKGKTIQELLFGIEAGLDQFETGVQNLFNTEYDYIPATSKQMLSGMVREDLSNVDLKWYNAKSGQWEESDILGSSLGQGVYDAITTTSNMAPSILASVALGFVNPTLGSVAGNALMGASAAGNAYQSKINLGFTKEEARKYGLAVGASEVILGRILGGISKLGGGLLTKTVLKSLDSVDNVFARFAKSATGKVFLNASSEAIEEGLQNVIEPYLWQAISGVEASVDWQESLYNALMGFATGGFFEGSEVAINEAVTNAKYAEAGRPILESDGGVDSLKALANEVAGVSSEKMQKAIADQTGNVDKKTTARSVGKLFDTVQKANNLANASQNQADIAKSLQRKGFSTETANNIAEALVASYNGQELTNAQSKLLKSALKTSVVQEAISNIIGNKQSTMGQRSQNIRNFSNDIALGMLAKATGVSVDTIKKQGEGNLTTTEENASDSHYEVSEDGKMVNTTTGDVIEPKGLVQAKDGTYRIAVKDADPVSPGEVSYADNNQAIVYESFVNLGKYSGNTSNVIADMSMASRNELLGLYDPNINKDGGTFVNGVLDAYFYGHRGVDMTTASKHSPIWELTEQQRKIAWNTGRVAGIQSTNEVQKNVDTVYAEAEEVLKTGKAKKGSYHAILADGITPMSLNETQKVVYRIADDIAQGVQTNIRVYTGNNKAQGFYNHATDEIWLNLNAADTGREAIMAFTLAHELVHRAKKGSPAKYQAFVDFLMKEYGKQGSDVEVMIAEQMQAAKNFNDTVPDAQKVNMTREKALEEVVCDACQKMLLDTNAGQRLAEFGAQSNQNKSFLEDLKRWISELMDKLRSWFKNVEPDSLAAKEFSKFDANVKQILANMYVDMAIESGEKLSSIKAAYGGAFAEKFQGLKDISYNFAATESHKAKLEKEYSENSSTDLETIMARYDKIIDIWTRLGGELNSKFMADWNSKVGKDRTFTIFKAQAGYKYNVELSSMCKKGVPLFEAIDTIVKQEVMKELEIDVLGKAEKEILYDILKQHNFEIPCAICYVEQARQREGVIIDAFLNGKVETNAKGETTKVKLGWNQVLDTIQKEMKANGVTYSFAQVSRDIATEKYAPANLDMDSRTQEAFYAALKKVANQEISRYNKAEGKSRKLLAKVTPEAVKECFKGTLPSNLKIFKVLFEEPSSRFKIQKDLLYSSVATQNLSMAHNKLYGLFNSQGGVSGYKTKQGTTIYWGDILGKTWKPDTLRNEGGVRNQSNSDFQMYTLLDQAQMYIDFTAKGYYLQAYTKVLSELKLFGLSRGKINASLIPKVVVYRNEDGSVDIEKTMATAGLDENGNPIYDDIEGINHDEAFMLIEDPEYSKSICGICIGYSDAHINKLLDDNRVQQIIGFHDKTDDGTKRYKGARYAKNYNGLNEAVNKEGKTVHIGFNPYVKRAEKKFQFNAETETYEGTVKYNGKTYAADDIPRLATDLYLEMCAKKEYTPAYKDFAGHRNYYKLLADFGLYDSQGHYAPHRKVVYNMPDTVPYLDANGKKQTMKTYDYIKAELVKELTVRDSISEALADTSSEGIIPQFKAAVKNRQAETSHVEDSQDEKSFSLSKGDQEYMDAVNRGDMETAQRMVDEAAKRAGYTTNGYHGSPADFTVVDGDLWITRDRLIAQYYYGRNPNAINRSKAKGSTPNDIYGVYSLYYRLGNNLFIHADGSSWGELPVTEDEYPGVYADEETGDITTNAMAEWAKRNGYDSITFVDVYDGGNSPTTVDVVFNPNRDAKSADPVTYDDQGNVIPLSERFNAENDDIRYSLPKSSGRSARIADIQAKVTARYKRSVDKVLAGTYNSKDNILMGYTPEIFTKLGMPSLPFVVGPGHIYSATVTEAEAMADPLGRYKKGGHYHGLGVNAVKNLYAAIQDPIMIIVSKDTENKNSAPRSLHSVVAIVDVGVATEHLLLPVELTATRIVGGNRMDVNVLSSAYTRSVGNLVEEAIAQMYSGDIGVYYAKKEAIALLSGRVSFPKQLTAAIASDGIVHHFTEKVNMAIADVTQSLQFVSWFGDWQNDPQHSSKVVNDDGTPMVVYHGTKSRNIKTFRTINNNGTGGLFLSTNRSVAEGFAGANGEVYESYVNIRKPFIVDAKSAFYDSIAIPSEMIGSKYAFGNTVDTNAISAYARESGYDGVIIRNVREPSGFGDDIIAFAPEQVKSIDNIGTFDKTKANSMYKLPIGEDTSPRALLANAFEGIITNDIEKRRLEEYKGKVDMLNSEEQKLRELRAEIKELSFAKGKRDTKKIKDLQFDAIQTANRIATLDKMLLRLEAAAPLQSILKREKEMAYKRAEQKGKEALEAYRKAEKERDEQWRREVKDKYHASKKKAIETRDKREAREKLQKLVLDTVKWITYPSKTDVKCPDILKKPYADFLNSIDLSSQRLAKGGDPTKNDLRMTNAMSSLATALERVLDSQNPSIDHNNVDSAVLDAGYLDLPVDFVKVLRKMTDDIQKMMGNNEYVVNRMPATEVRKLTKMIRTLNHAIKEVSTLYANLRFANVEALGEDTMSFIDALGEIEKTGGIKDFVQWDNALPYYAFKRFGKGGESIFEGLMDAQDKLAYLAQQIFDFREKAWTDKEAKAWSEDTHTIDLPNGSTLTLTTADAMSIYCLSRREHALPHLLGGGVRVIGIQKGSQKAKDSYSLLTVKDIDTIISSLTDRQIKVAEAIQEFMSSVCSDWGNEISMKRFLTKEFNEKFYFPIESNDENLPEKDPSAQQSDLYRLLNISATKPLTENANNEVIIRNIFDVFTNHASDMARLNAYGMALLDYMKWLNYREKTINEEGQNKVRGVRKSLKKAFGDAAGNYIRNLIKDVNGRPSDNGDPTMLMKWMRNAKIASVGANLRVAVLQLTAYPRAAMVLSTKSISLGLTKVPQINKAKKYCGIALWKSFGFYNTNIARSIEDQMKGATNIRQKIIELSMKGAEIGDAITWGALWNACEYEVAATKKYKVGTEEFYQEVGKKLREVVYATQVVDSTLTRSSLMRSKSGTAQEAASFMSEPTTTSNILMNAGFQFVAEKRRTGSIKAAWHKTSKLIGRAIAVHFSVAVLAALVESLGDAWRDDDDEERYTKFFKALPQNVLLNILPFNKVPILSDVVDLVLSRFGIGFFSSEKLSTQWLSLTASAADAWGDVLSGNSSVTPYNAMYKTVRAISSGIGLPIGNAMREGVALWNNTAGAYDITWKIRTWDLSKTDLASEALDAIIAGNDRQANSIRAEFTDDDSYQSAMRTAIKDRYTAGEIDYNTAMQYLIKYGGMEEDDAYWKAEEWMYESETGDDFGKYDEFFTAVETGKNLKAVIKKYTDNGVSAETLATQITNHYKPLYIEMSTSQKAGIKGYLLNAYEQCGVAREDATKTLQYWELLSEHPDSDLNKYQVADYYEFAKPAGISVSIYTDYCNKVNGIEGEDKKERRMAVIHSMPLSTAQKDALYYAEGWAASRIYEAPWH